MRFLLTALLALVLAPAALAGPVVDRAVEALRSNPVYVDPAATETITPAQADALRREIRTRGEGPIYVAILPGPALDEEGGSALGVLDALYAKLRTRGVYAVVAGGEFRAASADLGRGVAARLATEAYDAHRGDGIAATLIDFVDRVGDRRSGAGSGDGSGTIRWLPILVLAGVVFFVYRAFRRRRASSDEFRAVRETAREDLVALAEDVQQLEQRVEGNPAAKRDYLAALDRYASASGAFDRARSPQQLAPVAEALEDGRYLMASAEARLDGREPPARRPPCFFDPRHGPSVRDVPWSPDGYAAREVPACAACALRVEEGLEPQSRQVVVGGAPTPYWAAGPLYGGYFGGFFPGLLLGELLGGAAWGGWDVGGDGGDVGDFGDGGGAGDFGGGDFGGDGGGGDF